MTYVHAIHSTSRKTTIIVQDGAVTDLAKDKGSGRSGRKLAVNLNGDVVGSSGNHGIFHGVHQEFMQIPGYAERFSRTRTAEAALEVEPVGPNLKGIEVDQQNLSRIYAFKPGNAGKTAPEGLPPLLKVNSPPEKGLTVREDFRAHPEKYLPTVELDLAGKSYHFVSIGCGKFYEEPVRRELGSPDTSSARGTLEYLITLQKGVGAKIPEYVGGRLRVAITSPEGTCLFDTLRDARAYAKKLDAERGLT